ncbi:MAG TPA: lamin tail domain-containing protein, partial [Rudaea sp.]|nr:lamin tail domain-containing protein [Rudaea sp.]
MQNKFTRLLFILAAALLSANAGAQVVISQVYGGAGCSSAGCSTYKNDYIEIFNAGSATVSLNGWSVQYASATGSSSWTSTPLGSVSIASGKYLLIAEGAGSNGVNDIPAADVTGSTAMSATAGKVALVNATTALSGACPIDASIQDKVGYGSTANCSETSPAPAPSTTNAIFRAGSGCTDTGNNSADFSAAAANPRNASSDAHTCAVGPTKPTGVGSANPIIVQAGDATTLTVIVTPGTDPVSQNLYVEANLASIGGPALLEFDDDGPNPDGTETFSYAATVTADQIPGPRTIPLTVGDEMDRVTNPNVSLTVIGPPMTIMAIQGHGAVSPFNGSILQTASTSIVTVTKSNGFFMQDADGDGDFTTSDGIFVYTGNALRTLPSVHAGDAVSVVGTVQ